MGGGGAVLLPLEHPHSSGEWGGGDHMIAVWSFSGQATEIVQSIVCKTCIVAAETECGRATLLLFPNRVHGASFLTSADVCGFQNGLICECRLVLHLNIVEFQQEPSVPKAIRGLVHSARTVLGAMRSAQSTQEHCSHCKTPAVPNTRGWCPLEPATSGCH